MAYRVISHEEDWRSGSVITRKLDVPSIERAEDLADAQLLGGAMIAHIERDGERIKTLRYDEERVNS